MKHRFRKAKKDDFLVNLILLKRNFKLFVGKTLAICFVALFSFIVIKYKSSIAVNTRVYKDVITKEDLFKEKNLKIEEGLVFLEPKDIKIALFKNKNSISKDDLSVLKDLNLVKSYTFKVVAGELHISILEKNIIGRISSNGVYYLLDDQNNIVKFNGQPNKIENLLSVVDFEEGFDFASVYVLLNKFKIKEEISKVRFFSNKRCNIYFKNNLIVKLPYRETEDAMERLMLINQKFEIFKKRGLIIDLKIKNKAFIQKIDSSSIEEIQVK
jgi:hypothetical protein